MQNDITFSFYPMNFLQGLTFALRKKELRYKSKG